MSESNELMTGKVFSINRSKAKGVQKSPVNSALLIRDIGLEGDAHAGAGIRQVSLLSIESIIKQKECVKIIKQNIELKAGDFAENITTQGIDLSRLKIGGQIKIGRDALLEISKIGKECHRYCAIYYKTGDCIMPREGIFAKVIESGEIFTGDIIREARGV